MPETAAVIVDGVRGWKLNNEKTHALLGLTSSGVEVAIAISEKDLWGMITGLLDATAAFPLPKGTTVKPAQLLTPEWFEFGQVVDAANDYFLSFFLPNKGHVSVQMGRRMCGQLLESIEQELKPPSGSAPQKRTH